MSVNLLTAKDLIVNVLEAGLVPMITSSPGMGKSSIAREIAKKFNLVYLDERLSYKDPVDLGGMIHTDGTKATYLPFDNFPTKDTPVVKGTNGWLLNLDEFNSAPRSVVAAAYKLVLDRCVGNHPLNDNVYIMACGNFQSDNAIVEDMGTAMQSRLVHIQIHSDVSVWTQWAYKQGIDSRIIAYVNWKKENLNNFNPDHTDVTFACERTWEFASKLIKNKPITPNIKELLRGTVGAGVTADFVAYTTVFSELPTIQEIIANPELAKLPTEPSRIYAISTLVAYELTVTELSNLASLVTYARRLPIDFQVLIFKDVIQQNKTLLKLKEVVDWSMTLSNKLM